MQLCVTRFVATVTSPPQVAVHPNRAEYMRFLRAGSSPKLPQDLSARFSDKKQRAKLFADWRASAEDFSAVLLNHTQTTEKSEPRQGRERERERDWRAREGERERERGREREKERERARQAIIIHRGQR